MPAQRKAAPSISFLAPSAFMFTLSISMMQQLAERHFLRV